MLRILSSERCGWCILARVSRAYQERAADQLLRTLLAEVPALLIVGPRATGKTTSARQLAATVVRLDREAEAAAFRADPDASLRGLPEPVLLDEWQAVPGVLGAVKRAVDDNPEPGRFVLTGSVRADLDAATWPGTGRLVRVPMYGLTVRERRGRVTEPRWLDRLVEDGALALSVPKSPPDLREYLELALEGGFPELVLGAMSPTARTRWLESYVGQLLTRDAAQVDVGRDPERLRRYFEALAGHSASTVADSTLAEAAGLTRKTAAAYDQLLENLLVSERLHAWTSNRLKRLTRAPKRYLVDPVLAAAALRVDVDGVLRDGALLGGFLDTFVAAQLRAELPLCTTRARMFHLRQEQGRHEIDLMLEFANGRVIAIEVKADGAPSADAAKHLRWLRDELGAKFEAGVVLHTGPRSFPLDDRIAAVPICSLWG